MAAPIAPDRALAAEVRRLTLNKIKVILERPVVEMSEKDKDLHDAVLIKLAGSVLPRLNEVTGEDGGVIKISFDPAFKPNGTSSETETSSPEPSPIQSNTSGA